MKNATDAMRESRIPDILNLVRNLFQSLSTFVQCFSYNEITWFVSGF